MESIFDLEESILDSILPIEEIDQSNVVLEIKQAAGGTESSLFADDLKKMYENFTRNMGWRWQVMEFQPDLQIGRGCKSGVFKITGENVYYHLRHESGVHKVQRVPETEKMGRLHSSSAVIIVMPEVPRSFQIDSKDIRIDTYRAQGAGGQHVNTTDSAVRATHIPTGIVATNQDERCQHSNKEKALATLHQRIF